MTRTTSFPLLMVWLFAMLLTNIALGMNQKSRKSPKKIDRPVSVGTERYPIRFTMRINGKPEHYCVSVSGSTNSSDEELPNLDTVIWFAKNLVRDSGDLEASGEFCELPYPPGPNRRCFKITVIPAILAAIEVLPF